MKVTNLEVWAARSALAELLKLPLPILLAYALAKMGRQVAEQYALLEQLRNKLILQYGEDTGQGQTTVQKNGPNWPQFVAAYNELMAQEVDIGPEEKIAIPADDGLRLSGEVLLNLEPFVEVS